MWSLFISKNADDLDKELIDFCLEKAVEINAHSFLSFQKVPFTIPDCEVVFFSSPRSVEFTISNIPSNCKIACTGKKTADVLQQNGFTPDFIATQTSDLDQASKEFANWVGNRKVFFPCSDISKKSFTQHLPEEQVELRIVYNTIIQSEKIKQSDILIFTSPSNVNAFFQKNKCSHETIIAWGESTSKELKKNGKDDHFILTEPSQKELVDILSTLIS